MTLAPEYVNLADLLPEAVLRSVSATAVEKGGRTAVRVELLERISRDGIPDVDYVDMPTMAELPIDFADGTIEVDVWSELNGFWPDGARGFAGLAFRVVGEASGFESLYVRPTNGRGAPSPRSERAVQYFAYPDWRFERLRDEFPGVYETGADIALGEWITLRVRATADRVEAFVNGEPCLDVSPTLVAPTRGHLGLFVDIGTIGYFSNLRVSA